MFKEGFTLVEIIVIIAIIAIVAAMTIPNLLRARVTANEVCAIETLRNINRSTGVYLNMYSRYPNTFTDLSNATPPFVNSDIAAAVNSGAVYHGYLFNYTKNNDFSYLCSAHPAKSNITGVNSYRVTESGVIEIRKGGIWQALRGQ